MFLIYLLSSCHTASLDAALITFLLTAARGHGFKWGTEAKMGVWLCLVTQDTIGQACNSGDPLMEKQIV